MSEDNSGERGLGADFPGGGARFVLRLLLPAGRRDEFVGDLIEEAETVVLPQNGRPGPLFYPFVIAMNSALLFAILGLMLHSG